MRVAANSDSHARAIFGVMRDLALRSRALANDAQRYERELAALVRSVDETLLDEPGIGPISAAKLLACDPSRFTHEAAFARCNGRPRSRRPPARPFDTDSTAAATAKRTTRSTRSRSSAPNTSPRLAPTRAAHQRGQDQARSPPRAQTPQSPATSTNASPTCP